MACLNRNLRECLKISGDWRLRVRIGGKPGNISTRIRMTCSRFLKLKQPGDLNSSKRQLNPVSEMKGSLNQGLQQPELNREIRGSNGSKGLKQKRYSLLKGLKS